MTINETLLEREKRTMEVTLSPSLILQPPAPNLVFGRLMSSYFFQEPIGFLFPH